MVMTKDGIDSSPRTCTTEECLDLLVQVEQVARENRMSRIADQAADLTLRLSEGRFYLACIGQFKRGKSTFINAMLGQNILPTGVAPVTAIVTVLRHGPVPVARVGFQDGGRKEIPLERLPEFVTEEHNPRNRLQVAWVEVQVPSPLLADGMCMVDTPGIGSVFSTNTASTLEFVPHIDAAVVVLGCDPPISGEELELVREVSRHCRHLLFALNKSDKLAPRELEEGAAFTRRILCESLGRETVDLFRVSARNALEAVGETYEWAAIHDRLKDLARESGAELVLSAALRGLHSLFDRMRRHVTESRDALVSPLEVTERRLAHLNACIHDAQQSLSDLTHLFNAEQERISRVVERNKEEFLEQAWPAAKAEFLQAFHADRAGKWSLRGRAVAVAQQIAKSHLDAWFSRMEPRCEALYVEASERFARMAADFFRKLEESGDPAFAGISRAVPAESGFRVRSRLYYAMMVTAAEASAMEVFLSLFRTRSMQMQALTRQLGEDYLRDLLEANSNRIATDFDERVMESRRRYESRIREAIAEVAVAAQDGLERARSCLAQGQDAVVAEVARLDGLLAWIDVTASRAFMAS